MTHRLFLCACLFAFGVAVPALAEEHPATQSTPAAKPESKPEGRPATHPRARAAEHPAAPRIESKGYGAWALRCAKREKHEKESKTPRQCEISETIAAPNHAGTLAKITVARLGGSGALSALILLPNNVSFPSSVHLRTDAKDIWGLELEWVRCVPGACVAQASLGDATLGHWRSLKTTGSIVFRDSNGSEVRLPMTFDGFGDALEALNKATASD